MDKVWTLIGPPGTGKTTSISRQVQRAADKFGPGKVVVCSLTKTAAREAGGRVDLPKEQVGTLHAMAYRALNRPELAETKVKDWNAHMKDDPQYALSGSGGSDDMDGRPDGLPGQTDGDKAHNEYHLLRAMRRPREAWPSHVTAFANRYEAWKREADVSDFTDLLERAITEVPIHPASPLVMFVDEGQDFSRLEMDLVDKWSRGVQQLVLVGDPYQCLYEWRGSDPGALFRDGQPSEAVKVLSQSWRLPRAVHQTASDWIKQIPGYREFSYAPRDEEGECRRLPATFKRPSLLLEAIEEDLSEGRSVMVQASCGFFLGDTIKALRAAGIPYHNPWRPQQGAWNPLAPRKGLSTAERMLAFLRPNKAVWGDDSRFWTLDDLKAWTHPLPAAGIFQRGAKKAVEAIEELLSPRELVDRMRGWFEPEALQAAAKADVKWWLDKLPQAKRGQADFLWKLLDRGGIPALTETPQVTVGTIHSLKGAEADSVYLFPDVSRSGYQEWSRRSPSVYRLFYVGLTRARQRLTLCGSAGPSVPL
jgi:superfamily I DNA/RNA helicase